MRRRHAVIGEDEVMAAAMRIALDRGLHAVTAETVAAFLGVPVAVVARLQPKPAAFTAEVFRRAVAAELAEVKRAVLVHPAPLDQLRSLIVLLAEPARLEIVATWSAAFGLGRLNPELAAAVRGEQAAWHRFLLGVVQRGVRTGDWTTDRPEAVAAHVLAVIDGINAHALVGYDVGPSRRSMVQRIVELGLGVRLVEASRPFAPAAGPA